MSKEPSKIYVMLVSDKCNENNRAEKGYKDCVYVSVLMFIIKISTCSGFKT